MTCFQEYRAVNTDKNAWERALRPKPCKLAQLSKLRKVVTEKLLLQWSPEQLSGWLRSKYPTDDSMQISY